MPIVEMELLTFTFSIDLIKRSQLKMTVDDLRVQRNLLYKSA